MFIVVSSISLLCLRVNVLVGLTFLGEYGVLLLTYSSVLSVFAGLGGNSETLATVGGVAGGEVDVDSRGETGDLSSVPRGDILIRFENLRTIPLFVRVDSGV